VQVAATAEVILVHGLWYGPWAMAVLARRLRRLGYAVRQFAYKPKAFPIEVHAGDLLQFARESSHTTLHFVGHSLGGLVILHMLAHEQVAPPGRAVLLGSPVQGSRLARHLKQIPGGKAILGQAAAALYQGTPHWAPGREIGMIAGCTPLGLGRLLGDVSADSDGTVALSEADAAGLSDRVVLPVSHTGMLTSGQVARETDAFLQNGRFTAKQVTRGA
jgi:pimeloyl-ACP methyl ester carboxylesterase